MMRIYTLALILLMLAASLAFMPYSEPTVEEYHHKRLPPRTERIVTQVVELYQPHIRLEEDPVTKKIVWRWHDPIPRWVTK